MFIYVTLSSSDLLEQSTLSIPEPDEEDTNIANEPSDVELKEEAAED